MCVCVCVGGGGGGGGFLQFSKGLQTSVYRQRLGCNCQMGQASAELSVSRCPLLFACICSGQLAEVLNLVPWGGVSLQFRHLRLFGMQGIGGVGEPAFAMLYSPGTRTCTRVLLNA